MPRYYDDNKDDDDVVGREASLANPARRASSDGMMEPEI